jgi:hypothetical protein
MVADYERQLTMADSTLRDAILQRLGRFPARVPLNATFGAANDQGDHTPFLIAGWVSEWCYNDRRLPNDS